MILKVSCQIDKEDIDMMLEIDADQLEKMSPDFMCIYNACIEIYKINDHTAMEFVFPIQIDNLNLLAAQELRRVLS